MYDNWIGVLGSFVMITASFYALIDILVLKKRREKFLIGTAISFLFNGLFGLPFYIFTVYLTEGWPFVYLLVISIFSFQLAHTLFTV